MNTVMARTFSVVACLLLVSGCAQLSIERPSLAQSSSERSSTNAEASRHTPAWTHAERYPGLHPLRRRAEARKAQAAADVPSNADETLRDPAPLLEQDLIAIGYASITAQRATDPAQQRLMAARASRLDAYRNLAEQVYGLTVLAETSVNNDLLRDDRLRSQLMGFISGAELVAMEPLGNDTYQTTLRLSAAQVANLRAQAR